MNITKKTSIYVEEMHLKREYYINWRRIIKFSLKQMANFKYISKDVYNTALLMVLLLRRHVHL